MTPYVIICITKAYYWFMDFYDPTLNITRHHASRSFHVVKANTSLQEEWNKMHQKSLENKAAAQICNKIGRQQYLTKNLWFSWRRGGKEVQNFSMSALMSPDPPITSMNFFLSGASFMAICNLKWMISSSNAQGETKMTSCSSCW